MMSVSLDGFFETADRDISWHLVDDELLRHLNEQFRTMGAFMFGRVTMSWREMPKFVFHGPSRRQAGIPR